MTCQECDGIGSIEFSDCHHSKGCACRPPTWEHCDSCEGTGRLCDDCLSPLPLESRPSHCLACWVQMKLCKACQSSSRQLCDDCQEARTSHRLDA